jgi:hypothetical protein
VGRSCYYVEQVMIEDLKELMTWKAPAVVFAIATGTLSACVHVQTLSSRSGSLASEELHIH